MSHNFDPTRPIDQALLTMISDEIDQFFAMQQDLVSTVGAGPLLTEAITYASGGKRLRPAFAWWGFVAAAGIPDDPAPMIRAAASLDLLHASALAHDDLIDASDTRRGGPAAHKFFATAHEQAAGSGEPTKFGDAAAVLLGDLLLVWSAELFDTSGLPQASLQRALPLLHTMRSEVTCGQYLDVAAAFGMAGAGSVEEQLSVSERILEYKSARYSIRRPAQIGACLGDADDDLMAALGDFGSALGRAFQLRDDVLGVFGDPDVTGKPAGDDLREGKRTLMVLHAIADGATELEAMLGTDLDDAAVDRARSLIMSSGALEATEAEITALESRARHALDSTPMTEAGREALTHLIDLSIRRER